MITLPCKCGYGKHILSYDEKTEAFLKDLIKKNGEYKKVISAETHKAYKVPVAYILVHGLKGNELNTLGFDLWEN